MASTDSLRAYYAPPPSQNWTRRAYHASALVGSYVYIDMGEVAIGTVPLTSNIQNPQYTPIAIDCTLTLSIGESWTDPSNVVYNIISKPQAPVYDFSALWYDSLENSLYSFGGEESWLDSTKVDLAIWKLELDGRGGGNWTQNTTYTDPPFAQGLTRPFGGASTYSNTSAFYLGGYSSAHSSPGTQSLTTFVPTPGLIEYTLINGTWTNSSAGVTTLSQSGSFEWGGMEYVPSYGPNGLLVIWGGETSNSSIYFPGIQERSMNQITLLDPVTKEWYQQDIPGTVPSARNRFCSIGVADPRPLSSVNDTGTYEIFIYGGYAGVFGNGAQLYDEVWVLTLPAFTWLRVDASQKSARIGHTCHLVGQRQMLSIGGADAAQTDTWSTPDYTNINGLGVFDLVAEVWSGGYNASAGTYQRGETVQEYYDTNGAYPSTWTQPGLRDLFVKNTPSSTAIPNANKPPAPQNQISPSHTTITAIIASSAIGGSIVLFLPFLLVYLYLRRKSLSHHSLRSGVAEMSADVSKHEIDSSGRGAGHGAKWKRGREQRFVVELDGGGVAKEIQDSPHTPPPPLEDHQSAFQLRNTTHLGERRIPPSSSDLTLTLVNGN